jgi:hypothetical protein
LRDRRRLEEALKAARVALNAIEVKVVVAHVAADRVGSCRVGMCIGTIFVPWMTSRERWFP